MEGLDRLLASVFLLSSTISSPSDDHSCQTIICRSALNRES